MDISFFFWVWMGVFSLAALVSSWLVGALTYRIEMRLAEAKRLRLPTAIAVVVTLAIGLAGVYYWRQSAMVFFLFSSLWIVGQIDFALRDAKKALAKQANGVY